MSILSSIIDAIFGSAPSRADAEAALDAKPNPQHLDWRNSIVDLMKLLGQDSSLPAREALAKELGYTGALDGSAEMNIWLHEQVMERVRI